MIHVPIELKFHSMSYYGFTKDAKVTFTSNKKHEVSISLLSEEYEAIMDIVNGCRSRALKEIPEMIAEVLAEERVAQILAKRGYEALAMKPKETTEQEIPF